MVADKIEMSDSSNISSWQKCFDLNNTYQQLMASSATGLPMYMGMSVCLIGVKQTSLTKKKSNSSSHHHTKGGVFPSRLAPPFSRIAKHVHQMTPRWRHKTSGLTASRSPPKVRFVNSRTGKNTTRCNDAAIL